MFALPNSRLLVATIAGMARAMPAISVCRACIVEPRVPSAPSRSHRRHLITRGSDTSATFVSRAVAGIDLRMGLAGTRAQDKPLDQPASCHTGRRRLQGRSEDDERVPRVAPGACDRCHGANQEGLVGPSLVKSLKTLSKEEFVKTVRDGRLEKGMDSSRKARW